MSFLAPWALLLAAAAGVPLLLHLLRRRAGEKIPFPAVRYLLRMEREHAREVKLRNLLLMLLRIGIVLAIALAAARPVGRLPGIGHPPSAVAIVIDNSLSASAAGAQGPMLGRLTASARGILDAARAGDRLWLLTMDQEVTGGGVETLRAALARLAVIDGAGDPAGVLRRAATLVRASGVPAGRVVLLTDGQATSWASATAELLDGVPLTIVQPAGAPGPNRAITAITTEPLHWNPRGAVQATVSGGDSTTWRIVLAGRTLARGSAQPGATVLARVQPIVRGWQAGTVELAPDELRGDDVRHFAVHVGEPPTITVDAAAGVFLRGAGDALVQGGRAVRGEGVLLASGERARRPGLIFAPSDPVKVPDANRALERAGIPWRFGARRDGPSPLRGGGVDGAIARSWHVLTVAGDASDVDTIERVGGAPWAVAGEGYVLVASAAEASATDLTVRAAFIPWVDALLSQRLAGSAGGITASAPGSAVRVPATVEAMESPDGGTRPVAAGATMEAPWTAGVHFWRRGPDRVGALVVNAEPAESDLLRLEPDSLAGHLVASRAPAEPGAAGRAAFAARGSRTLDRTFLVLALALLAAEAIVARRGVVRVATA